MQPETIDQKKLKLIKQPKGTSNKTVENDDPQFFQPEIHFTPPAKNNNQRGQDPMLKIKINQLPASYYQTINIYWHQQNGPTADNC